MKAKRLDKKALLLNLLIVCSVPSLAATQKEQAIIEENTKVLELYAKETELQQYAGIKQDVDKNLNELKNMQISMKTKNISISNNSIIQLDLHHIHFTKLYFPEGTTVVSSKPSTPFQDNSFFSNRVEIRPKNDLLQASISIMFVYKNKTYDITIVANKYDISNKRNKADNIFYPKVNLSIDEPLKTSDILKSYRRDYEKFPDKQITFYEMTNKIYVIEKGDFKTSSPTNKPNAVVLYENELQKYKITLGEL